MKTEISNFYCTQCGRKGIMIHRKQGQGREAGHLKRLYCLHCNKETNHAEIRHYGEYDYEDFQREYLWGNFDEDGNRKIPWKKFRAGVYKLINALEEFDDEEYTDNDVRSAGIGQDNLCEASLSSDISR